MANMGWHNGKFIDMRTLKRQENFLNEDEPSKETQDDNKIIPAEIKQDENIELKKENEEVVSSSGSEKKAKSKKRNGQGRKRLNKE